MRLSATKSTSSRSTRKALSPKCFQRSHLCEKCGNNGAFESVFYRNFSVKNTLKCTIITSSCTKIVNH